MTIVGFVCPLGVAGKYTKQKLQPTPSRQTTNHYCIVSNTLVSILIKHLACRCGRQADIKPSVDHQQIRSQTPPLPPFRPCDKWRFLPNFAREWCLILHQSRQQRQWISCSMCCKRWIWWFAGACIAVCVVYIACNDAIYSSTQACIEVDPAVASNLEAIVHTLGMMAGCVQDLCAHIYMALHAMYSAQQPL